MSWDPERTGRVVRVNGPLVEIEGVVDCSALFDLVEVGEARLQGEVVAIRDSLVTAQLFDSTVGLAPGVSAEVQGEPLSASLGPHLLGGVFDGLLRPLVGASERLASGERGRADGRRFAFTPRAEPGIAVSGGTILGVVPGPGGGALPVPAPPGVVGRLDWIAEAGEYGIDERLALVQGEEIQLSSRWPIRRPRPIGKRLEAAVPLVTGQRVLDLLHPVSKGSTAAVIGGFGTGKTLLLQQVAKWCDADVIVYVACGERGNELADALDELGGLDDPRTGRRLMERTVIVANASNMPVMAREASILTGVAVAEYFRDLGLDSVVIADSTSRWAEALREFASRMGELPMEEGYPAGLASALAAFYERAGRFENLSGTASSVTIVAAVSPPSSDMTEPVTSHTTRFVRCLWALDRDLAYARHYPAVAWRSSFSRDAEALAVWYARSGDPGWAQRRARIEGVLADAQHLAPVAELVGIGAMPGRERVVLLAARLLREAVLQQSALSPNDGYCTLPKQAALADAVLAVHDRCQLLVVHGVPATVIEETDFGPLVRARDELAPDDAAGVAPVLEALLAKLEVPA